MGSPYAVSIRHLMYERGGMGRKGGRRYQALALNVHAMRNSPGNRVGLENAAFASPTYTGVHRFLPVSSGGYG